MQSLSTMNVEGVGLEVDSLPRPIVWRDLYGGPIVQVQLWLTSDDFGQCQIPGRQAESTARLTVSSNKNR